MSHFIGKFQYGAAFSRLSEAVRVPSDRAGAGRLLDKDRVGDGLFDEQVERLAALIFVLNGLWEVRTADELRREGQKGRLSLREKYGKEQKGQRPD